MNFAEFRKNFFNSLEAKTGWGKEEVKKHFDKTYFDTVVIEGQNRLGQRRG